MLHILLFLRLGLAAVFALAGIAKLVGTRSTSKTLVAFGIPLQFAPIAAVLLPVFELAVAAMLLPVTTSRVAAAAAFLLLTVFTVAIGIVLRSRRTVHCNCFGAVLSKPIGMGHVARNIVLAGVAAVIMCKSAPPLHLLVGPLLTYSANESANSKMLSALVVVVAAQALVMVLIIRQNGRVLARLQLLERAGGVETDRVAGLSFGRPIGSPAPSFTLQSLEGVAISLGDLLSRGRPLALVFVDPECPPCRALLPDLAKWQRNLSANLTVVAVSSGPSDAVAAMARENGLIDMLGSGDDMRSMYGCPGTPGAIIVTERGMIGSKPVGGAENIESLIQAFASGAIGGGGKPPKVTELSILTSAPPIPGVGVLGDGLDARLAVFWDANCPFSQKLSSELRSYCADHQRKRLEVLVLDVTGEGDGWAASGPRDALDCLSISDSSRQLAEAFGARGTPIGILLDKHNMVLSPFLIGAEGIRPFLLMEERLA